VSDLRAGEEVVHSQWGFGTVLGFRPGNHVRVRFHDQPGLPRTVAGRQLIIVPPQPEVVSIADPVEETVVEAPADPSPRPRRRAKPSPTPAAGESVESLRGLTSMELADYRQTIEALRCGVLPAKYVLDYTVGRDRPLTQVRSLLEAGRGLRIVWGEYGAGKSHLLDVAEQLALEEGYLTSRITLDRHEIPPSHPQRLYSAIARRLRYPDDLGEGLEPLLRRLLESESHYAHCGEEESRFLSPYLHALREEHPRTIDWMRDYAHGSRVNAAEGASVLRWIRWPGKQPLTLSDYRTYGRVYTHLVGTIASWARDAGFRGLVLLFDEVEFLDSMDSTLTDFAREVLAHYAAATVEPDELAFDPDQLYKGGHQVHREMPLRFRADQPLSVVFALTPLPEIEAMLRAMFLTEESDIFLEPLDSAEALSLVERIHALYLTAYPDFQPPGELLASIRDEVWGHIAEGEDSPRGIVKTVCFRLDGARLR
jgi:hypothetical protein